MFLSRPLPDSLLKTIEGFGARFHLLTRGFCFVHVPTIQWRLGQNDGEPTFRRKGDGQSVFWEFFHVAFSSFTSSACESCVYIRVVNNPSLATKMNKTWA